MKVSIHMPACNAEATIASALKFLLRQRDAGELDIVVVDDGSTDRTCDVVGSLAARAPEIRLISVPHGGISRARNEALRAMAPDTDLVGFLDADDLSPEGRLARDVVVMEADPSLDLVYSKIRFFDREDPAKLAPSATSRVLDARNVNLSAGLFRRRLLDRAGLFDEALTQAEDTDYLLRLFEQRPSYLLSDQIGVFYRRNHGSITDNRRQVRQEFMKALLRRSKRQAHREGFTLPEGIFSGDHMAELETWTR